MNKRLWMIAVFVSLIFQTSSWKAEELRRDGFNDGAYLDGSPVAWSVDWSHSGNPTGDPSRQDFDLPTVECDTGDCYLVGHTADSSGLKNTALIVTNNPTDVGRWQFDSRIPGPDPQAGNFFILQADATPWDGDGYDVIHVPGSGGTSVVGLRRKIGTSFTNLIMVEGPPQGNWTTVAVSRDGAGTWTLYVNGGEVGVASDTSITTFPFFSVGRYSAYDNVVISSCVGTFGPQNQPLEFVRLRGKPRREIVEWESCGGEGELAIETIGNVIAEVKVNGTFIVDRSDRFRSQEFRFPIDLRPGTNGMEVVLYGAPGSALRLALSE